jgi:small subunit ribosomal protein S6
MHRVPLRRLVWRGGVSNLYPYEILVIFDPRPTDDDVAALLNRLQETLKTLGGQVGKVESWGKRRLTFEIRKQREGTYAVIEASAEPATVKEFERQLRLNEQVLRFVSTRVPVRKRARARQQQQEEAAAPAAAAAAAPEEVV